jgi:CRP-like cAMP-binding protein
MHIDAGSSWKDLPERLISKYAKGQTIYLGSSHGLYMVASGRVKVTRSTGGLRDVVAKIVPAGRLFGESSLIGGSPDEEAVALDVAHIVAWSCEEVERSIENGPPLGVALMRELVAGSLELKDRIHIIATCPVAERVMFSLGTLARSMGEPTEAGASRLLFLTHKLIAEHAGTTREIVTTQMNRLRRRGLVEYSRRRTDVYLDAMVEILKGKGVSIRTDRRPALAAGRSI